MISRRSLPAGYPPFVDQFVELYEQYIDEVLSMARRLAPGRNEATAQDATQEVFFALLTKSCRGQLREIDNIRSWLFAVLHHKLQDDYRRTKRRTSHEDIAGALLTHHQAAPEVDQQVEDRELIRRALLALQPRNAQLVLDQRKGYSISELAALHQMTDAQVRTDLYRARRQLRTILSHDDGGLV